VIARALAVLDRLLESGDALVVHELPSGGDLRELLDEALAEAGRAFRATAIAQSSRQGLTIARPEEALRLFPYSRWNRSERMIAPPIVVKLRGTDLRPGALLEYLDGTQKIVLLVDGPMSVAPMARVITPALFVAQTDDAGLLESLAGFGGAGVLVLGGEGAARFVHDPRWTREGSPALRVDFVPPAGTVPIGGTSAAQQADEIAHLSMLSVVAAPVEATSPAAPPSPVDTLASWLLQQAGTGQPAAAAQGSR
jgi:hypothetical protein